MVENWKPIAGYEDAYEVSDLGRVRSLPREIAYGAHVRKTRLVMRRFYRNKRGEVRVKLAADGCQTAFYISALVLETFIGPRPPGSDARHRDLNPENNTLANLGWGPEGLTILSWSKAKRG